MTMLVATIATLLALVVGDSISTAPMLDWGAKGGDGSWQQQDDWRP